MGTQAANHTDEPVNRGGTPRVAGAVFLLVGCLMVWHQVRLLLHDLREVFVFEMTAGAVIEYQAPDATRTPRPFDGRLTYRYTVDGVEHTGAIEGASRKPSRLTEALLDCPRSSGESLDVYYDPSDPSVNTLLPVVDPERFAVITFVAPFALIGFFALAKPESFNRRPSGGLRESRAALAVVVYTVVSAAFAFTLLICRPHIDWTVGAVAGAFLPTVIVPASTWLVTGWTSARLRPHGDMHSRRKAVGLSKTRRVFIPLAIFAVLWWAVIGMFLASVVGELCRCLDAQQRYMATTGQVVKNGLQKMPGGRRTAWRPIVVYDYRVGETEYRGDQIHVDGPMHSSRSPDGADEIRRQYPFGSFVTVYYDPDDPERSMLDTAFLKYYSFDLFGFAALVGFGLVLAGATIWLARPAPGGASRPFPSWLMIVLISWFVAHVLAILALALAEAYRPERASLVWIAVGVVALGVAISGCVAAYRSAASG